MKHRIGESHPVSAASVSTKSGVTLQSKFGCENRALIPGHFLAQNAQISILGLDGAMAAPQDRHLGLGGLSLTQRGLLPCHIGMEGM